VKPRHKEIPVDIRAVEHSGLAILESNPNARMPTMVDA